MQNIQCYTYFHDDSDVLMKINYVILLSSTGEFWLSARFARTISSKVQHLISFYFLWCFSLFLHQRQSSVVIRITRNIGKCSFENGYYIHMCACGVFHADLCLKLSRICTYCMYLQWNINNYWCWKFNLGVFNFNLISRNDQNLYRS